MKTELYLDDFLTSDGTRLDIKDIKNANVKWLYKERTVRVSSVSIINCENVDIELGSGTIITPVDSTGISIQGGSGRLLGGVVQYPDERYSYANRGVDVNGAFTVEEVSIHRPQIGILLRYMGAEALNCTVYDAEEDHIRVMSGFTRVIGNTLIGHKDTGCENHRDLVQIVAANWSAGKDEFLDTPITNVAIEFNTMESGHPDAQGIMASDGVSIDWSVKGNLIDVPSTHGVTINRAQAVTIEANKTNSYINIGSRKKSINKSSGVILNNNTSKDIIFVDTSYDALAEMNGNDWIDGGFIIKPRLV